MVVIGHCVQLPSKNNKQVESTQIRLGAGPKLVRGGKPLSLGQSSTSGSSSSDLRIAELRNYRMRCFGPRALLGGSATVFADESRVYRRASKRTISKFPQ